MSAQRRTKRHSLSVRWDELIATDFPKAVTRAKRVCLLPIGVVEKHGPHLPLGTDIMAAHELAVRAAQQEYVVVFPSYYFGQIFEGRHEPGCIAIDQDLLTPLLENMCDEIARNGLDKIVIVNGHGGNTHWLNFFCQLQLSRKRDYAVYIATEELDTTLAKKIERQRKTDEGGHACEFETSLMMAIRPDLVQLERAGDESGKARERLKNVPGVYTGIWWYADFPNHYSGDARPSNVKLGEMIAQGMTKALVRVIRAVKKDSVTHKLQNEFHAAAEQPLRTRRRKR